MCLFFLNSYISISRRQVVEADHITERQRNAKKYFRYGGYIKEFISEQEARQFADSAKLEE